MIIHCLQLAITHVTAVEETIMPDKSREFAFNT